MNILLLGAYGLIGAEVARRLQSDGHRITGLGRSKTALDALPILSNTIVRDLADLTTPTAWAPLLINIDAVVNCAGALQDGGGDTLETIHHAAIAALAKANAEGPRAKLIQISACGAAPDASTAFMRTKSAGDAAIRAADVDWWILRPGLVIARSVYGGTALLRQLAATPAIQPIAFPAAPIQCVWIDDLTGAVARCLSGDIPPGFEADLVEPAPRPLADVVAHTRHWLGFPPARRLIPLPNWLTSAAAWAADRLGALGWRSPLRTNAMNTLRYGVTGDPVPWRAQTGAPLRSLEQALAAHPATVQDRLHARLTLLAPLFIAGLALFWLLSGLIGLAQLSAAAAVLTREGWPDGLARASVAAWSIIDILLAIGLTIRKSAARAAEGMFAVSLIYLAAATLITPALWLDPLGPLVKILPALMAILTVRALLETR
ncbi:MAG: SDR family oxidoreductase [Rhodobacteraceae bacterium]|nr:SDR family oxidoreductase [Paracoccaceae bacterium]